MVQLKNQAYHSMSRHLSAYFVSGVSNSNALRAYIPSPLAPLAPLGFLLALCLSLLTPHKDLVLIFIDKEMNLD